jgi:thiol-disulfide isomerase/thioredoxin
LNKFTKRIEVAANIAIICVAVMIGILLIKPYLFTDKSRPAPRDMSIPVGTKVSLPEINWHQNGKTLLLVLQKGCHFCTESAPLYQRLVKELSGTDIHLVAVLPQDPMDGKKYLDDLGVGIKDVKQAGLSSLGVAGTPTLILLDDKGVVEKSWVGKLSPEKETELLGKLQVTSAGN